MKSKYILLAFIPLLVSCVNNKPVNPTPTPEPVDENISLTDLENGLRKIESNFKGQLKETTINTVDMGITETRSIISSFEKSTKGDIHLKRTAFDYDANLNLDKLSEYYKNKYALGEDDPQIKVLVDEVIHDHFNLNMVYSHEFSDDEMTKTEKEVNLHANVMNYLGHTMDNDYDSFYWSLDYIDYYKFLDGPISHEYFKGRRKFQKDYDDHSERQKNDLFYFIYDLAGEVNNGKYDKNSKSYSFSSDFLLNYADFGNKYRFNFSGNGLMSFFQHEEPAEIEIKIEFNTKTKDISKVILDAKHELFSDMAFTQEYLLEIDYVSELNSEIELNDYPKKCNHEYLNYDFNDEYHYYCCQDDSDCKKVISYEPHDYDENGKCKDCSYEPTVRYDVRGDHVIADDNTIFFYSLNLVTNKITYYGVENYLNVDRLVLNESVVKNEIFEGDETSVYAEKDHDKKDSYYLLVSSYTEEITPCLYKDTTYMYLYFVENDIPTLIGTTVENYEDVTHHFEIVEGSVRRIDDHTCHATIKCRDCELTLEDDCNVYLSRSFDHELNKDNSYLYIIFEQKVKEYETESHSFYYYNVQYDENGFDTITHTHKEREYIGTEETGIESFVAYYHEDGSIWYISYGNFKYTRENVEGGYKLVFSSFGDNSVELYKLTEDVKDTNTCQVRSYETYKLVVNGVTVFEETSNDIFKTYGENAFDHNFEYVEGSLTYDQYFDEYTFKVKCLDCGEEYLVEKYVSINSNYDGKLHTLRGYYYYYNEHFDEDFLPVEVECKCEPSEENEHLCKWCEGYIGELK